MKSKNSRFENVDFKITNWMAENGIYILRLSIGLIFVWYGVLKFFPEVSSAENIASVTIEKLSFGLINGRLAMFILATWETLIGLGLLSGLFLRETLLLLFLQMLGTLTPLLLFPEITFKHFPFVPTLEGQYIFKNLVIIASGIVIGSTVRGGRLISQPDKLN
ncbi:MAG: DoxX family membrane protein [Lentimicrobium sp.]|nr:DoxX family membrane protein [Lentimicrobium sp.]